jgi:phage shock protein B
VSGDPVDFNAVVIIFMVIVLPVWLFLHYGARWRQSKVLTAESERTLGELSDTADRLQTRIDNLERLLDVAAPEWRKKL